MPGPEASLSPLLNVCVPLVVSVGAVWLSVLLCSRHKDKSDVRAPTTPKAPSPSAQSFQSGVQSTSQMSKLTPIDPSQKNKPTTLTGTTTNTKKKKKRKKSSTPSQPPVGSPAFTATDANVPERANVAPPKPAKTGFLPAILKSLKKSKESIKCSRRSRKTRSKESTRRTMESKDPTESMEHSDERQRKSQQEEDNDVNHDKQLAATPKIVDPAKVRLMGNIDDIAEKEEQKRIDEIERMDDCWEEATQRSNSVIQKNLRVKIAEDNCKLYETNKQPATWKKK